ncbi:ABC transporter ATP-binding protein [Nocardia sp. NPDC057353]|uniref:ABC transporter ATP-binding protein n=1 Tax=Nocardia sp. NPDC057353 TaxID=3346104 RepID=UPI00363FA509
MTVAAAGSPELVLRPHLPAFAAVVLLRIVAAVAGLAPLLAVAEIGRALLAPGPADAGHLRSLVLLGAAGLLVRLAATAASSAVAHLLDLRVQLELRRALAVHLGRVPLGWFADRRSNEPAQVVGPDVAALHPVTAHAPAELVSAFVVPLISLSYLFAVDWRLTLITLIPVFAAVALVPLLMTPARTREQAEFDAALGRIADAVVEFVRGIAVVKTFGGAGRAHRRFTDAADAFVAVFLRWVRAVAAVAAGMQLALAPPVVLLTVLAGGAAFVANGSMAPADILPFLLLGIGLTAPVAALGHGFDDLTAAGRALDRIRAVLAVPPLPEPDRSSLPADNRIELRGVRFGYEPEHEVLRGVDLVLEPGTVTAVTGPSGSGKSTLVQLLARFLEPTAGTITLGGVGLRDLGSAELYRRVSFVFQDVRVLRASVAENIALAVPDASRAAIERAAAAARLHRRILALPRGYDTVLGAEAQLSGGEAQRLALARALLADAPVLVLDEATAFADPRTERAVRDVLAARSGARTVLVIAHRPETVAAADTVVALADGRIASRDTLEAVAVEELR